MESQHLLITFVLAEPLLERIRSNLGFASIAYYPSKYAPKSTHPRAHWGFEPADIPADVWEKTTVMMTGFSLPESMADVPNLRFIQGMSAGVEHLLAMALFKEPSSKSLIVATASGIHPPSIGEYVMMQSLNAFHRQSVLQEIQSVDRSWAGRAKYVPPGAISATSELRGATMGILGYGCIGRECARLASAFGMKILAANSSGMKAAAKGFIVPGTGDLKGDLPEKWYCTNNPASLQEFLEQVDILVLACPMTPATKHIISATTLGYLKKTAYVINIARGPVIDHEALYTALEEESIAGAILDVTDPEPLPEGDKMWTAKNCVITPHISGSGRMYESRCGDLLEVNVKRLVAGEEVLNKVDLSKGY